SNASTILFVVSASNESRPVSPSTDSTESALGEGEDPNDPEWTCKTCLLNRYGKM
ncbi:hypothetical protein L9F63_000747, partial [Diploptera punctata]